MQTQFNQTKYTKWYFSIIDKRKSEQDPTGKELHHIIPRKLGGNNKKENLVYLTYKEHFIVHHLLTKMVNGLDKKYMFHALNLMAHTRNIKLTSRLFSYIKTNYSIENKGSKNAMWGKFGKDHPAFGHKHTKEERERISLRLLGKKHTNDTKEKISQKNKGKKRTEEYKKRKSLEMSGSNNPNYGKHHSSETKEKIGKSRKYPRGKDHPSYGKIGNFLGKTHKPESIEKWKKSRYKHSHIFDIISKEHTVFFGSLRDWCNSKGSFNYAGILQRTLKTKTPIKKGPLKGLILLEYY